VTGGFIPFSSALVSDAVIPLSFVIRASAKFMQTRPFTPSSNFGRFSAAFSLSQCHGDSHAYQSLHFHGSGTLRWTAEWSTRVRTASTVGVATPVSESPSPFAPLTQSPKSSEHSTEKLNSGSSNANGAVIGATAAAVGLAAAALLILLFLKRRGKAASEAKQEEEETQEFMEEDASIAGGPNEFIEWENPLGMEADEKIMETAIFEGDDPFSAQSAE
jgi:hypothetical protein